MIIYTIDFKSRFKMCGLDTNSCTAFSLTVCSTFKENSGTIKECSLNEKANNPSLGSKSKTSSNIEIGAAPAIHNGSNYGILIFLTGIPLMD